VTAVEPATGRGAAGLSVDRTPATPAPRRPRRLVPSADVVRVLTFACVIAVHTLSTTHSLDDPRADGLVMLLHFTREAFFVLTAFVLMHSHGDVAPRPGPLWRRRFLLVGVPYVVWTAVYTALEAVSYTGTRLVVVVPSLDTLKAFALNLATGTGWYHLYFLLVSMQFYLLFPLFRRLMVATRGHHRWVLLGAAVLQVLVDLWIHDPAPNGLKADLLPYAGSFVGSYVFFLALGGVAAQHRERVFDLLRLHPVLVVAALVVTGAAAEGWYLGSVATGANAQFASDVFQPVMLPWVVAVVAGFALLGLVWARRPARSGRSPRWVTWASERSFGVFLVHPVILFALTVEGPTGPFAALPPPLPTAAVYLTAVLGSLALVAVFRATPLRMPLTGKPSDGKRR
jgi:peptidoglycan/LPS O-acetylase OafA/YrhL